ncbi:hypothetical protein ACFYVR_00560 [Rhodococcus sp. NPDC003318]|uniref:hypothetical protein n=1 Tax=Rhodococcus sp. NPDC003318 TaxID=3364503 RepID=UPI0036820088
MRPFVRACAALSALALAGGVFTGPTAAAASPEIGCAWQFMSDATTLNVAFPDASATYWVLPYALVDGDRITVHGWYPYARYMSLNTYGTDFDTVDTLRDDEIAPDPGSGNPFADPAAAGLPPDARRWQVTVTTGTADRSRNEISALPTAPGAQRVPVGFLIVRVYVPDDPQSLPGSVPLPEVSLTRAGRTVSIPTCRAPFDPSSLPGGPIDTAATDAFDAVIASAAAGAFPGDVPEATFVNPASTSGLFPNGDNKYVGAGLTHQPGRIVVVRGRAPTFPDTGAGVPPAAPGTDVRYWSMCQNDQVSPYPVVACAADHQTRVDDSGFYTYVVAAPADLPPRAATDPTVTVLPWGSTEVPKKVLFLRHMLPSAQFYPRSVQASQAQGSDPAVTMGDYYPRAAYCATETFQSGGWRACLGG